MDGSHAPVQVVCYGEVLWDSVPQGLFLGGAPFNVAAHLTRLGVSAGVVSAVGTDVLGAEIRRRAASAGLPADLIQQVADLPTGFVDVTVRSGSPSYVIRRPAAWDAIRWSPAIEHIVEDAEALVFGTLAQRAPESRNTLKRLLEAARRPVLDINLRPPFDDPEVVAESLRAAHVVKLNDDELVHIVGNRLPARDDDLRASACVLSDRYGVDTIIVTRGAAGASLLHDGEWIDARSEPIQVADTIGAGDAFLAGFLAKWLVGTSPVQALRFANQLGGLVASYPGAIPDYDAESIKPL